MVGLPKETNSNKLQAPVVIETTSIPESKVALSYTKQVNLEKRQSFQTGETFFDGDFSSKRDLKRPEQLELAYKLHPLAYRGIETRVSELFARGHDIIVKSEQIQEDTIEWMKKVNYILKVQQAARNAYIYGNGYIEIVTEGNDITDLIVLNPKVIDFQRDETGKIVFGPDGKPKGFQQQTVLGKPIKFTNTIAHFMFTQFGDMLKGVSILQACFSALKNDLNIQSGVAQAIWRHGFPQFDITVGSDDRPANKNTIDAVSDGVEDLQVTNEFVHSQDVVVKVLESTSPRSFDRYNKLYISQIVSGLGVPAPLLLGSGENSNRSTAGIQSKHFRALIENDQNALQAPMNVIFSMLAELRGWSETPELEWSEILPEDETARVGQIATLVEKGIITINEARDILGLPKGDFGDLLPNPNRPEPNMPPELPMPPENRGAPKVIQPDKLPDKERAVVPDKTGPSTKGREALSKTQVEFLGELDDFLETVKNSTLNFVAETHTRLNNTNMSSFNLVALDEHLSGYYKEFGDLLYRGCKAGMKIGLNEAISELSLDSKPLLEKKDVAQLNEFVELLTKKEMDELSNKLKFDIYQGFIKNESIDEIREKVNKIFSSFGCASCEQRAKQTKSEMIAKTELFRSFNDGLLIGYTRGNINKVNRVLSTCNACEECKSVELDNTVIQDAMHKLPHHVGCECTWKAS